MKGKILLTYNYILHYRVPLFNLIAEQYDLTVLHSGKSIKTTEDKYKEIIVPFKKIGPFFIQEGILWETKKEEYDIIIHLFDVRWVNTVRAILDNKEKKTILWGAWLTNSKIANVVRLQLLKKASASLFYTEKSKMDFIKKGLNKENCFVANNTFDVGNRIKSFENLVKNRILFVGSLNPRKGNITLINAFANIIKLIPKHIILTIIGDGEERQVLEQLVKDLKIENHVNFTGKINNPEKLKEFYKNAIVSVSYGQAGLSVLQSIGFGVPFLTKYNAITGGEIENIIDGYNGVLCEDNQESLEAKLIKMCNNIPSSIIMGKNAYEYYSQYCTIENMCQGFLDSIENTRLSEIDERY